MLYRLHIIISASIRPIRVTVLKQRSSFSNTVKCRDDSHVFLANLTNIIAVLTASSPVTDDVFRVAPLESRIVRFQLYLTVLLHYQHVCL